MRSHLSSAQPTSRWTSVSRTERKPRPRVSTLPVRSAASPPDLTPDWPHSDEYRLIEPQIDPRGVHVWPFESAIPLDLRVLVGNSEKTVKKNRHDYFEILLLCSGATFFLVEDRRLPMTQGDLAIIGSELLHSTECPPSARSTLGVLYFDPNFIAGDGMAYSTEYLAPFLNQDSGFPHIVTADTGVPAQIFDLMQMIQEELPGSSRRARLAINTYLKMILVLLVNQYSIYASQADSFKQQERALDSLHNFFEFLPRHVGDVIHAPEAARMCGLCEADFTSFLRQLTGKPFRSFLNHYRVERAQAALSGSSRPISEIAQEMGFCDQSYFGAVFNKLTGMTPLSYRRRQRGEPADQTMASFMRR